MPNRMTSATILHLSDIHRTEDELVTNDNIIFALKADLHRQQNEEKLPKPDLLIISGDLTQSAKKEEYDEVYNLINELKNELTVPEFSRVILVPGNHDINWAISKQSVSQEVKNGKRKSDKSDLAIVDEEKYSKRLDPFRDLYGRIYGREYGIKRKYQFDVWEYPEFGICIVGLNSCDGIDHSQFKGGIYEEAVYNAEKKIVNKQLLKIAVWHHDLNWLGKAGQDDCLDPSILGHLVDLKYGLALCGHTHRADFNVFQYPGFCMPVIAAGSICAGPRQREESIPRLYNLIHINGKMARVNTRSRQTKDLPWRPYTNWGKPPVAYFDIELSKPRRWHWMIIIPVLLACILYLFLIVRTDGGDDGTRGIDLLNKGNYSGAVAAFVQAQKKDPDNEVWSVFLRDAQAKQKTVENREESRLLDKKVRELAEQFRTSESQSKNQTVDEWTSRPLTILLLTIDESGNSTTDLRENAVLETLLRYEIDKESSNSRIQTVEHNSLILNKVIDQLDLSTSTLAKNSDVQIGLGRVFGARLLGVGMLARSNTDTGIEANLIVRVIETETTRVVAVACLFGKPA